MGSSSFKTELQQVHKTAAQSSTYTLNLLQCSFEDLPASELEDNEVEGCNTTEVELRENDDGWSRTNSVCSFGGEVAAGASISQNQTVKISSLYAIKEENQQNS